MYIDDSELLNIVGGAVSSTFLNAVSRLISTITDLGRTMGGFIYLPL